MAVRGANRQRAGARALPARPPRTRAARSLWAIAYRLCCLLFAVGLAGLLWQLLTAAAFRVDRVDVKGNYLLTRDEINQTAGVLGQNLLSLDRQQVARKVLGLGTVKSVEVRLSLPNAVSLLVEEYEPRYIWQVGEVPYLVDERGVVLAQAAAPAPLPGLKELDGKPRRRGERVNLEALQAAARLKNLWPTWLGAYPGMELSKGGLALNGGKWRADLGSGADLEAKVLALAAVFDKRGSDNLPSYIDVSLPERPYFK
ncbi:MAG: FtsQ-type POTRA domain-containing protein [Chloroflexi bacterium]|nr:FtsQ-type POTRA domain-containing protein [Chloroflexota bacterium]MCL5110202.1 FtsQ-type POTRA domain-containing protein [Chloroflexota bacterium]